MPILLYNFSWMIFNIFLAVLAVILGYYFLHTKNKILKILLGVLWLLFIPNTIYVFTDLIHIFQQWGRAGIVVKLVLIVQYVILQFVGIVTFILAYKPFETTLKRLKIHKNNQVIAIIIFNFFIAFGMVLGRIERLNSWDVFISYTKALDAVIQTLSSSQHLLLILLFGLFCNFIYFLLRDPITRSSGKFVKSLTD